MCVTVEDCCIDGEEGLVWQCVCHYGILSMSKSSLMVRGLIEGVTLLLFFDNLSRWLFGFNFEWIDNYLYLVFLTEISDHLLSEHVYLSL